MSSRPAADVLPLTPDGLLPFTLDEEQVVAAFRRWVEGLSLAPGNLRQLATFEECVRHYVPYWLFDATAHAVYAGRRGEPLPMVPYQPDAQGRRTDRQGRLIDAWGRPVNEFGQQIDAQGRPLPHPDHGPPVRWHEVSGEVHHRFRHFPLPAGASLPDRHVGKLKWDFEGLRPYQAEFVQGARVGQVSVGPEEARVQSRQAMDNELRAMCAGQIGGARQEISSFHSQYAAASQRLVLAPVWLATYTYRGKRYTVAINGDTGEVAGERPYSYARITLLVAGIVAVVILVVLLALFLFSTLVGRAERVSQCIPASGAGLDARAPREVLVGSIE